MAGKRKGISPSLRWSVFSRDGFTCRYCGRQAGQEGVELAVDHVVSVLDGGTEAFDNLVTACKCCNGGKGARSLQNAPTSKEVIERIKHREQTLLAQAQAIAAAIEAEKDAKQTAVNLKCQAYGEKSVRMAQNEDHRILTLCREFGPDRVIEWYQIACRNGVRDYDAIRYVSGIVKNIREREEAPRAS
jgi:hypothetical protein